MSDELVFWRTYGKDGKGCSLTVDVRRQLLRKVLYEPADVGSSLESPCSPSWTR